MGSVRPTNEVCLEERLPLGTLSQRRPGRTRTGALQTDPGQIMHHCQGPPKTPILARADCALRTLCCLHIENSPVCIGGLFTLARSYSSCGGSGGDLRPGLSRVGSKRSGLGEIRVTRNPGTKRVQGVQKPTII